MSFDETIRVINDLVVAEQRLGSVNGRDDLEGRRVRRFTIRQRFHWLEKELRGLQERIQSLPTLPPIVPIHWAQSVRTMSNLVFLELDTTGLQSDAEIIRAVVLDAQGHSLLDLFARPSRPLIRMISSITGITNEQIQSYGIPAQDLFKTLQETLMGKYLLSYNLDFDRRKLQEAARRLKVDDIQIIGEDLMVRVMLYFSLTSYPKLEALCERIGQPLPVQPHQTAIDRARGQIALLNAMADVIMGPGNIDESDLDEHPF